MQRIWDNARFIPHVAACYPLAWNHARTWDFQNAESCFQVHRVSLLLLLGAHPDTFLPTGLYIPHSDALRVLSDLPKQRLRPERLLN
jgi:hypothetical protein